MDAIGDALGAAFEAVARLIFSVASRLFNLTARDSVPGWAKFAAGVLIFSVAAILTFVLWAYVVMILAPIFLGLILIGAVMAFISS
jgi:hypothetical protein